MRENRESSGHVKKKKKTNKRWTTERFGDNSLKIVFEAMCQVKGWKDAELAECYSFMAVPVTYQIFGQSQ